MNSSLLFCSALIVPVFVMTPGVLLSRKNSWLTLVFSILVYWALFVFSYSASLAGPMRGSSADKDYDMFLGAWLFLLGWIPAGIYCALLYAFFQFVVLRKLRLKADK